MTKQDILDYFSLIDFAYNESGRLESLSRMLDKLLKEHEAVVRCKDCIWFHKPDAETKKSCKCNYHGGVTEGDRYCWWGEKDA